MKVAGQAYHRPDDPFRVNKQHDSWATLDIERENLRNQNRIREEQNTRIGCDRDELADYRAGIGQSIARLAIRKLFGKDCGYQGNRHPREKDFTLIPIPEVIEPILVAPGHIYERQKTVLWRPETVSGGHHNIKITIIETGLDATFAVGDMVYYLSLASQGSRLSIQQNRYIDEGCEVPREEVHWDYYLSQTRATEKWALSGALRLMPNKDTSFGSWAQDSSDEAVVLRMLAIAANPTSADV
jgi:hypothetical protein